MRNYDILFLDIDGTLIGPDHFTLSPRNREALLAAKEAGIILSIASGRCLHILPQQAMDVGFDYAITSNGAAVDDLHSGQRIYTNGMSVQQAELAYRLIRPHADFIEWFANGHILLLQESYALIHTHELPPWHAVYFAQGGTPVVESAEKYFAAGAPGLEKISLVRYPREVIATVQQLLNATGQFAVTHSIGRSLEIISAGCSKGAAIRKLCGQLGISLQRAAACGDAHNDVSMLQTVGGSCAMGNAKPEIQAAAAFLTAPFDQDGVAEFIEKHVL